MVLKHLVNSQEHEGEATACSSRGKQSKEQDLKLCLFSNPARKLDLPFNMCPCNATHVSASSANLVFCF